MVPSSGRWTPVLILVGIIASSVPAARAERDVVPERHDERAARAAIWRVEPAWKVSTAEWTAGGGTRVAALLDVEDVGPEVRLEARGVSDDGEGPWLAMEETFRGPAQRVAVVDLGESWPGAQIRLATEDDVRVGDLAWELLLPRYPDAGRFARAEAQDPPEIELALASELDRIGVVSRAAWGARSTQCSSTEDDWYRMAIHHTAGAQTSGGSVQGAVRALQAYAMDSGGWCDIPYQMLVGYDGSLWEGRPLHLCSGATGGGQNDGNLAISFLGCYHPNSCPGGVSHTVTEEMIASAHLLTQTLVRLHDIPSNADSIRGHRDWPGNSTVCPGDYLYPRLDDLRADMAWYAAEETARSFPDPGEAALQADVGESVEVWIEMRNTGGMTWEPGVTFLGTTHERDSESPLYDPSWPSPGRAATVDAPVPPGAVGRFTFRVQAAAAGDWQQSFGLVQEMLTWFGDAPWGGGPGDDAVEVSLHVASDDPDDPGDPGDPDDPDDPDVPGDGGDDVTPGDPGTDSGAVLVGGCAVGQTPGRRAPGGLLWLLLGLGILLRLRAWAG
jgi:N-acetylmuramoyl-L-alanine amidase